MKKSLTILVVVMLGIVSASAQSCLPEGIWFSTQGQIDSFQNIYPNCTEVEGDVIINGLDITNLNGLSMLTSIGGILEFGNDNWPRNPDLTNLTGLENLTSIGGNLYIHYSVGLTILTGLENLTSIGGSLLIGSESSGVNPVLTSLSGLDNLTSIGGNLRISENDALTSLTGLDNLISIGGGINIEYNDALTSLTGLDNIDAGSISDLHIHGNNSLSNCNVQSVCDYLTSPNGVVWIHKNAVGCNTVPQVADNCGISLQCLPYGNYDFLSQADIDSFQLNFPNCTELQGSVYIWGGWGNDITNLYGLNTIISIEGLLSIHPGDSLTSLLGLENLTSIGGGLNISNGSALTSLSGLDNITFIGGSVNITNNDAITSLTGLDNVTYLSKSLRLYNNSALTNLTGLDNVTSIGGRLDILHNDALTSLEGLEGVTSIGGDLIISTNISMTNLSGLENLTSIGGRFGIGYNDALTSLTGLDNVTSIGGDLVIVGNDALTGLTGLDNIDADSIEGLVILENPFLSHCAVLSICNYLNNPNGTIEIDNNTTGCESPEEVQDSCIAISANINEQIIKDHLTLYPNPASQELNISVEGYSMEEVSIYTLAGQQVQHVRPLNSPIDISGLQPGMYIVEATLKNSRIRQKLLVQR